MNSSKNKKTMAAPHECVIRIGLPKTKVRAENEAWFY